MQAGAARPACVILDEVDGMDGGPSGGVTELLRLIKATPPFRAPPRPGWQGATGAAGGGGGGKRAGEEDDDGDSEGDGDDGSKAQAGKGSGGKPRHSRPAGGHAGGSADAEDRDNTGDAADGGDGADGSGGGGGKARGGDAHLRGPVIAICNDQYAPVLRDLRPHAYVIELGRAPTERLVARLKHVAAAEALPITTDALTALAAVTDNDVRGCLNTLQFLKYSVLQQQRQQQQQHATTGATGGSDGTAAAAAASALQALSCRITAETVTRAAVGLKDQSQAVFDLWQDVFRAASAAPRGLSSAFARHSMQAAAAASGQAPLSSSSGAGAMPADASAGPGPAAYAAAPAAPPAAVPPPAAAAITPQAAYYAYLHAQMGAYSAEPRLLLSGLHENMYTAAQRVADPCLARTAAALDWLCYGEEIACRSAPGRGGEGLAKFLSVAGMGIHLALASDASTSAAGGSARLAWPRADAAARRRQEGRRHVLDSLLLERARAPAAAATACCGGMDRRALVLDLLSPLLSIVSPRLRAVQPSLYNSREKRTAQELVEVRACED
jgi:hypothetical protein